MWKQHIFTLIIFNVQFGSFKIDFGQDAIPIKNEKLDIEEDLNNLDLSTLPVHSSNIEVDENCPFLKHNRIVYRYETVTKDGEHVGVLIESRALIEEPQSSPFLVYSLKPWINGRVVIKPHLYCFQQDDPRLIDEIKTRFVPANGKPLNLTNPVEVNIEGEVGQPVDVDKLVYGGELKNGFFLEAGSFEAEKNSDSLYFEVNHGWTGLLVEAEVLSFSEGLFKNRNATHIQTCLATETKPQEVIFDMIGSIRNETHRESMGGIALERRQEGEYYMMQCLPLYSILMALGNPTVHYFSLDVEGAEFPILKSVPWDKVDIKVLSVETHLLNRLFPGDRDELIEYMESVGYRHIPWGHVKHNRNRKSMGTRDDMFVKRDMELKMTKEEKEEWDRVEQQRLEDRRTREHEDFVKSGKKAPISWDEIKRKEREEKKKQEEQLLREKEEKHEEKEKKDEL